MNTYPAVLAVGVVMSMTSGIAYSARPYLAADFSSNAYWDTHHVCLVRIAAFDRDEAGKDRVHIDLVRRFSEWPVDQTIVARRVSLSYWPSQFQRPWERPELEKGDMLVVAWHRGRPGRILTHKLEESPDRSPFVSALSEIAELRASVGAERLSESVFSANTHVALYGLKQMMTRGVVDVDAYVVRLLLLRDDVTRDVEVRLMASQLASRIQGDPVNSDDEYAWVRQSLEQSRLEDPAQLTRLIRRLLEFDHKREENVAFLSRIARDRDAPEVMRSLAMGEFRDQRLFRAGNPDLRSDALFETAVAMLDDSAMSVGAAYTLWHLTNRIRGTADPEVAARYQSRAAAAIRDRLTQETDAIKRFHLEGKLRSIEVPPSAAPLLQAN